MEPIKIPKRKVEVAIISDVHLGTYGCHAKELLMYLKSIDPGTLILNGDIIDMWQFRKRYFPKSHMMVLKHLTGRIAQKPRIIYVTGNHDELLRKFVKFKLGSFEIVNKVILTLDGKKAWIFHGDVFDVTMQYSKWLAKLGSIGYSILIHLNNLINVLLVGFRKEKISLAKKIKKSVKSAVAYINKFEKTAAEIAVSKGYHYVICGHIHHPEMRTITTSKGAVIYLNSGDWIENLSALEYNKGEWNIYYFHTDEYVKTHFTPERQIESIGTNKELFEDLLKEFKMV